MSKDSDLNLIYIGSSFYFESGSKMSRKLLRKYLCSCIYGFDGSIQEALRCVYTKRSLKG
jgi:hypothetical protein